MNYVELWSIHCKTKRGEGDEEIDLCVTKHDSMIGGIFIHIPVLGRG
jgi:hypothetical protein